MARFHPLLAAVPILALGACVAAPPPGPSVVAMPGNGKSFAEFQQDDAYCRQYATAQTGGAQPGQAAADSALGSAAVGTALGAATGALIGAAAGNPGAGAAIGAGAGLLTGGVAGSANAQYAGATVQQRYDISYTQCMFGQGETVPQPPAYAGGYPAGYPGGYYGAPYGGPTVALGIGVGGGYYRPYGPWYHGPWYRGPYYR
ncbi:MAG: glycine zipper family protein [Proteobacteria bacterium]|nr:glycine zipper family protein [Pseudomonadota bacterium]